MTNTRLQQSVAEIFSLCREFGIKRRLWEFNRQFLGLDEIIKPFFLNNYYRFRVRMYPQQAGFRRPDLQATQQQQHKVRRKENIKKKSGFV